MREGESPGSVDGAEGRDADIGQGAASVRPHPRDPRPALRARGSLALPPAAAAAAAAAANGLRRLPGWSANPEDERAGREG